MSDVGTQSNGTPGRVYTSYEEYVQDLYKRRTEARSKALADMGRSPTEFKKLEIKGELGPVSMGLMGDKDGWHFNGADYKKGSQVNKEGPAKKLGWGLSVTATMHNEDWKIKDRPKWMPKEVSGTYGYGTGSYNAEDGDISGGLRWPPSVGLSVK